MKTNKRPELSSVDQELLKGVRVRLIEKSERKRYDEILREEHYLKRSDFVGEQLRYVAEYAGQWVGLLAWSAAAFNLRDREEWIGWMPKQKRRRLSLVANNSRFLIRGDGRVPNLASRVMGLCLDRLSRDWESSYGHPILVVETFVDKALFRGTCYKASGWTLLGQTKGYGRSRQDYYEEHNRPKQLWVRELKPGSRTILRGKNLPEALEHLESKKPKDCEVGADEIAQMTKFFGGLPDMRSRRGDYKLAGLVAVAVCAGLCGAHAGQRDLAAFAANMTLAQKKALGFPRRGKPRKYLVPKETTFFRLLSGLDSGALEKALLGWQDHVLGKRPPDDDQVSVDGKELLNSQGVEVVSAYAVKSGRWMGSDLVSSKSNEIPAAQNLLRRAPIEGMLVTADALHTQTKTGRIITQEKGGDYLFTVKGNQAGVAENVQQIQNGLQRVFFSSV